MSRPEGIEPDPTLGGVTLNSAHAAMRGRTTDNERRLKALLGQWVSELEPTIVVAPNGVIAGIGDADRVLLWAPGYPQPKVSLRDHLHNIMTGPVFP
jgi:hypothetical protein